MTATIKVTTPAGTDAGRTVELPETIFNAKVSIPLIHQVVNAQLAAARQGTHKTKTRGEVSGGGKKPYRQKGTGRARQGSIRAPQFAGGGIVHGPVPRDYTQRTPKKMKAAALRAALTDRANNARIHVITNIVDDDEQRLTRTAAKAVKAISERRHILIVTDREDERSWLALRNISEVHLLHPDQLNTHDVMLSDDVIFTEQGFADFVAFAGKSVSEKEAAK